MGIEEQRKKWQEEKRRQANEEREEKKQAAENERRIKQEVEFQEFFKKLKAKDLRRYKCATFIYGSIVQAFGEEKAKQIEWKSDVVLPIGKLYGDTATLDDLKFFEHDGSLCLLGRNKHAKQIYAEHYTADIIFTAEKELNAEICEAENKQKEILLRKEREERIRKIIEEQEKLEAQNVEVSVSWWQRIYISIQAYFQT